MVVRPLYAHERPLYARHLKRLSDEDRLCRFARAGVTDDWIDSYVAGIAPTDLILATFVRDELAGAAHLAFNDRIAEVGVSVDAEHRTGGVGSDLLDAAVTVARNRRAEKLFTLCLSGNRPMMALARRSGMELHHEGGDTQAHLELPPPDPLSLTREVSSGLFAVAHDWADLVESYGEILAKAVPGFGFDTWPPRDTAETKP